VENETLDSRISQLFLKMLAVENSSDRSDVDLEKMKLAVRMILEAVGEDPDRDGLLETPRRVAKMYAEMFEGLRLDPARHLEVTFTESYDEMVLVRDITFTSMCEHHLLPFSGVAHVAYLPEGKVTGLSKIARVVEEVARRPQVQERMTQTIADLVSSHLNTSGVGVVVSADSRRQKARQPDDHQLASRRLS
jgi:GTP cyclohydrolase I